MEYKIETDLNGKTHLVHYNNDDGAILMTGSLEECKNKLIQLIKNRHRITHITFSENRVIDHSNGNKELSCKEFCNF
jgi:hypothetical protein